MNMPALPRIIENESAGSLDPPDRRAGVTTGGAALGAGCDLGLTAGGAALGVGLGSDTATGGFPDPVITLTVRLCTYPLRLVARSTTWYQLPAVARTSSSVPLGTVATMGLSVVGFSRTLTRSAVTLTVIGAPEVWASTAWAVPIIKSARANAVRM